MVFTENDINTISKSDELEYLKESECEYDPMMVPIRYNLRLDQDMVRLESVVDYALSSGITDCAEAINTICEANCIKSDKISFMVESYKLYEDDELADTAKALKEHGYEVNIAPVSNDNLFYKALKEAIELDKEFDTLEESVHLQEYIYNENALTDRISTNWENMKKFGKDTVKTMSNKIASLEKEISTNYRELKNAHGEAKETINKQINKLKKLLSVAKSKLAKLKNSTVKTASNAGKFVKNKIVGAANSISSAVGQKKNFA